MKEISTEERFSFYLETLSHCGTFLLSVSDEEIEYHIFEEFGADSHTFLHASVLNDLLGNGLITKEIYERSVELSARVRRLDGTPLWNVQSVLESVEWHKILVLADEIRNMLNNEGTMTEEHIAKISEEELIAAAKPFWKERGFRKAGKRWTKTVGEFTMSFFIQGSAYDKEGYYVRPGVFFNALPRRSALDYGHIFTELQAETAEQVLLAAEAFFAEWADKALIKRRVEAFVAWEKRNPLEKRRAGLVDYDEDPAPAELFLLSAEELDFLMNEW